MNSTKTPTGKIAEKSSFEGMRSSTNAPWDASTHERQGPVTTGALDAPLKRTASSNLPPAKDRFRAVPGSNSSTIRLSGPIEHDSIVNGPGLRAVVWTQGCFTHCMGCQNSETWSPDKGTLVDVEEIKTELRQLKGQQGLTFCGGEPFVQPEACKAIADWAREEMGWNIWSFSGFTYEEIKAHGGPAWEFLKSLDVLIDGPFILQQRDISLKFRGSKNQRLLHLNHGEITSVE